MTTLIFYKPYGVLCQFSREGNTPTLADYIDVPDVYPAGRLDKDSEGLLILTDDGALAQRITDPKKKLPKVYLAQVEHVPDRPSLDRMERGLNLVGWTTKPAQAELLLEEPDLPPRPVAIRYRKSVPTAWVRVILREGKKHQVRRMTAAIGHPTLRLVRVAEGPISLEGLLPGEWRELSHQEVDALFK